MKPDQIPFPAPKPEELDWLELNTRNAMTLARLEAALLVKLPLLSYRSLPTLLSHRGMRGVSW